MAEVTNELLQEGVRRRAAGLGAISAPNGKPHRHRQHASTISGILARDEERLERRLDRADAH